MVNKELNLADHWLKNQTKCFPLGSVFTMKYCFFKKGM